jgi:hypothetical protein
MTRRASFRFGSRLDNGPDPERQTDDTVASAHKSLRLCDLCQELAFRTQRGLSQSRKSYNSFAFTVL